MTIDRRFTLAAALLILSITLVAAPAEEKSQATPERKAAPSRDAAGKDYAAELPRFAMKDPAESLRAIVARPGFHVELVAAEPMLRSPVAIDFDEDGRLYVAEFPEYNQYAGTNQQGAVGRPSSGARGCVRLLEDLDG